MSAASSFAEVFKGRPIAVLGLARSGLSLVKALRGQVEIYAWDDDEAKRSRAREYNPDVRDLSAENIKDCAFLVLSPGIPLYYPKPHVFVVTAQKAGLEVICDIELFYRLHPDLKTIGITGTNGKSTTTALIQHILQANNIDAVMCGNIGTAIFDVMQPAKDGVMVLELSSYQLDLCPTFRPDISILLNISPDHLDRHGSMENYIKAKARIFEGSGAAIISIDDDHSVLVSKLISPQRSVQQISVHRPVSEGAFINAHVLMAAKGGRAVEIASIGDMPALKGVHNYQNVLAAYLATREYGLAGDQIIAAVKSFPGLMHRQYPVTMRSGVSYVNDSKATNVEAAAKALDCYSNIFWIAGGRPKDGGLNGLEQQVGQVRHAYLIGEAMEGFSRWMKAQNIDFTLCELMDEAVIEAHKAAQAFSAEHNTGSTVLLSPACASFDQYSSFEERGDHFSALVYYILQEGVP